MDKPIRVAMIMGKMLGGGVESVVMNYYRHIDKTKFQFDFIIDDDSKIVPEEEINVLGGRVYRISPYQSIFQYNRDLEKLIKKNNYQIVHSHINSLSVFPLRIAKKCGVPIRIAHNHSTSAKGEIKKNFLKNILKFFSNMYPTHYMAPTYSTGKWLFKEEATKKNFFILNNAINLRSFEFNNTYRQVIRLKLHFKDEDIVIGNIGRFVWQKNQIFLIKLLDSLVCINQNYKLLLIGEGPLKKNLESEVRKLNLQENVVFVTNTTDIYKYYSAMDVFVFPSNYEGLGMVAIEAQIAGLPVLASKNVPREVIVSSKIKFEELIINRWVKLISSKQLIFDKKEDIYLEKIKKYDIREQSALLGKYYTMLIDSSIK